MKASDPRDDAKRRSESSVSRWNIKSYTYRLYPTDAQIERLNGTLSRCCELYNAALQERKDAWNACKKHPNFYDMAWRKEHAKEYRVNFAEQCRCLPGIRNEI